MSTIKPQEFHRPDLKFALVLIGNIASGKSSIAQILAKEWNIPHFSLDDYREKQPHSNRIYAENQAKVPFREDLLQAPQLIYESTYSVFDQANFRELKARRYALFLVKIHCGLATCRQRFQQRGERYLFGKSFSAMEMIANLQSQLQGIHTHQIVYSERHSPIILASQISKQINKQIGEQ